ncbi:MAG: tRNA (N(6)-L-threonylcarbamoyladenosine(37)-C(2))-methylthiotransferase MtaB [Candidatus Kapaibacteriales bacterium]
MVEYGESSDMVLINTCTVTHRADADCRKIVRRSLKQSPDAFIGVLGCYAQLQPDEIVKIDGVDAVFGQKEKFMIPELVKDFTKTDTPSILVSDASEAEFHTSAVSDNAGRTRAVLKLQDGCDYRCTFCTIPDARGHSRSMPFHEIRERFDNLWNEGFKEVVIAGINLGDYRTQDGHKFVDVAKLIDSLPYDMRIRISSIEPNLLKPEVLDVVMQSERFVPHFHIPLQSGSQQMLIKMKRRYRAKNYRNLIHDIKERNADTCIGADVIVGFPGETEDHFQETYDFIDSLPISYLHVFTYSERPGTPAAEMSGKIDHKIRKERTNILRRLSVHKQMDFYDSQVGKEKLFLPETFLPDKGYWKGWTENYVPLLVKAPATLECRPHPVTLSKSLGDKVLGEMINNPDSTQTKTKKYIGLEVV